MPLLVTGINHETAPVAVRERLAFSDQEARALLPRLTGEAGLEEALLLDTCNRSELYAIGEERALRDALGILCAQSGMPREQLDSYLYRHEEDAAVRHVFRVASGLDSLILGEPQILGQVKQAWHLARTAGTLGPILDRLLQHAFAVAKRVRSDTAIGRHPVSIAFAAVRLAERLFTDLAQATVLLIGAGEMIELAARHLSERRIPRLIVANRTLSHAQEIATRHGGYAITLEELPVHLAEADVVIASTASPQPIVDRRMAEEALARRQRRPMFILDIAVPRDIDPAVGSFPMSISTRSTICGSRSRITSPAAGRPRPKQNSSSICRYGISSRGGERATARSCSGACASESHHSAKSSSTERSPCSRTAGIRARF